MTRLSRPLLAAAVAFGALAAASAAHARTGVVLSIGFPMPYAYVQPAPVYMQQQPVYVPQQPVYYEQQPVYYEPQPVYVQPRHVYAQPQPVYYESRRWHHNRGPWGDADRDGVPDRYDRAPNNPYRR